MSPLTSTKIISILFLFTLLSVCASSSTLSAYDVLEEYDFPIGLLPNGVLGYELNSTTGAFELYLSNSTCTFSISSYELKYKSTISGVISADKLSSLSGIYVKIYFFWLSITEVIRDGDELEFSVGIASADFAASNFDECPTCGCGFDCDSSSIVEEKDRKKKKKKKQLKMRLRKGLVSAS